MCVLAWFPCHVMMALFIYRIDTRSALPWTEGVWYYAWCVFGVCFIMQIDPLTLNHISETHVIMIHTRLSITPLATPSPHPLQHLLPLPHHAHYNTSCHSLTTPITTPLAPPSPHPLPHLLPLPHHTHYHTSCPSLTTPITTPLATPSPHPLPHLLPLPHHTHYHTSCPSLTTPITTPLAPPSPHPLPHLLPLPHHTHYHTSCHSLTTPITTPLATPSPHPLPHLLPLPPGGCMESWSTVICSSQWISTI